MNPRLLCLLFAALVFGACSTPDSRIQSNQTAFNQLSADQQARIRAGQVDVGFTPDMVVMAMGEPDRQYTRTTAQGASEVWAYRERSGHFTFGFGIAGSSRSGGTAAGVAVSGGDHYDERTRVIFENGRVSAIEHTSGR